MAQHVADCQELWLVVLNDAAVGRDVDFAVREGIQRIERLIAADTWCQLNLYLDLGSCQVLHMAGLDLTLVDGF